MNLGASHHHGHYQYTYLTTAILLFFVYFSPSPCTSFHLLQPHHSIINSPFQSLPSSIQSNSLSKPQTQQRRRGNNQFFLLPSSATDEEKEQTNLNPSSKTKTKKWFPVKPEDALLTQYDTLVRGAYVRHVVLETEEMADLATQTYLHGGLPTTDNSDASNDPFGQLAQDLSICKSRHENGKIGWIDNPFHPSQQQKLIQNEEGMNEIVSELIPHHVIKELFLSRPKGGDVLKLKNKNSKNDGEQWHLCRIDDLLIDYIPNTRGEDDDDVSSSTMQFKQTGVNKVITKRSKLKGLGTTPTAPKILNLNDSESNDINIDNNKNVAKSYHITTTGCQMNVADSERLAGVLENKLHLEKATSANGANVIILNTCSIRDHAEQKVYDTLGPFAARKRKGESLALIVAGCVAQQEGEALLRRVPEVDLVMGPQYVNRLDDLLDDVSRGHQVVATDPTLLSEDLSRPVRGDSLRAWVNVIHGCNEHCTYCVVPGVRFFPSFFILFVSTL